MLLRRQAAWVVPRAPARPRAPRAVGHRPEAGGSAPRKEGFGRAGEPWARRGQLKRAVTIARRINAPIVIWTYPKRRMRAPNCGISAAAAASPLAASGPISTRR